VLNGLFDEHVTFELLPLADADIRYLENVQFHLDQDQLVKKFITEIPWRAENVVVWGKTFAQPRLVAWYGDTNKSYTYSGIKLDPLPWTEDLLQIKSQVERLCDASFNSVLLNYYRDNKDSMGYHSDDERELGPRPTIASISLGAERTFTLKHKTSKLLKPVKLVLRSGSVLLMKGDTQKNWKHGIEKEKKEAGPRINLTFRNIISK
jgi:alkylated DNA repair dioxygenase AlkB